MCKNLHTYFISLLLLCSPSLLAQSVDFTVPNNVCIKENIELQNSSTGFSNYQWDFCEGDLNGIPQVSTHENREFNVPIGVSFIQSNSKWYAFICSMNNNSLFRIDFGELLTNPSPKVVNLGNLGGKLSAPQDLKVVEYSGEFFAFINNRGSNRLIRINFGNNLENTSVSSDILLTGNGYVNGGLDVVYDGKNWMASLTNSNYLTLVNLLDSPANIPTNTQIINTSIIAEISGIGDVKFVQDRGTWYGFVVGFDSKTAHRLHFGDSLFVDPTAQKLSITELSSFQPYGLTVEKDNDNWIIFSSTGQGNLIRLNLGGDINSNNPIFSDLSKFGTLENTLKLDIAQSESRWVGLTTNWNSKKFYLIDFPQGDCAFDKAYSFNSDTVQLKALKSGTHYITLKGKDSNGVASSLTKSIAVSSQQAPQISIEHTTCVGIVQFSLASATELSSISWDFNADDITDATTAEAVYTYATAGNYPVTVEVTSSNGCSNRITKEITIYEPPTPNFSIRDGLLCSYGAIAFTNLTDAKGADDLIAYQWDFNGEGSSTAVNPSFTFTTGGTKTVKLTASIPGCSQSYSLNFDVAQGPVVGFVVPYICQGVEVQFENVTQGEDITSYHWDFGDGGSYTSTSAVSPFYNYQLAGAYTVVLSVENASGCINTFSKTVQVYARPQVNFLAEVACVGTPVRFTDQTTSGTTSNVVDWQWDFGDGKGTANVQNPAYTYTHPGTYQVKLVAQTSAGCKDSLVQEIIVETPVTADFTPEVVCQAEGATPYTVQFHDQSTVAVGNRITQWLWTIQGETFTTQDVQYIFDGPGVYEVILTTTAASACNAIITHTIELLAKPEVAFDYTPACAGVPFSFMNQTISQEGVISRYSWDFGGVGASFDRDPEFTFTHPGNYTVRLMAQTHDGCIFSSEQQVSVPAQPVAQFTPSVTFGAYPLTVQFNNQSTDATQYIWQIGEEDILTETNPVYTFTQPGQYNVTLTAMHESDCLSIENQQITVVNPFWDLVIESLRILPAEENGAYQVVLTIRNAGTVTVAHFPMSIKVDQLLELKENFEGHLAPGEKMNYPVSFTLSNQFNQNISVRYICATLLNGDVNLPDVHLKDNSACANLSGDFNSIVPYPNPVKDVLDVSLVLPQVEPVTMTINNSKGSQMKAYHFTETRRGLNSFAVDMSGLAQGMYLVQVHYLGKVKTYRVVVQP